MAEPDGRVAEPSPSQACSFGTAAERYDRYRPTYATPAVKWALGEKPLRVLDLGAGTGILSRLLQRLGHDVVAVEPDDRMRARLVEATPGVTAHAGAAEDIPLPAESVDAVVAGQAYHWFDPERAHPEIARVLRPGGVFAALWNDPDPAAPWTIRYTEIIDGPITLRPAPDFGPCFTTATRCDFRHEVPMTPEDLVAMATTRSPYLVAPEPERARLLADIRDLMVAAGLADCERFSMPHVTRVHRAYRR